MVRAGSLDSNSHLGRLRGWARARRMRLHQLRVLQFIPWLASGGGLQRLSGAVRAPRRRAPGQASANACAVPAPGEGAWNAERRGDGRPGGRLLLRGNGLLRQVPVSSGTESVMPAAGRRAPTYEDVKTGSTGHAESVRIVFDPGLSLCRAARKWFFRMHDRRRETARATTSGRRPARRSSSRRPSSAASPRGEGAPGRSQPWRAPLATEIEEPGRSRAPRSTTRSTWKCRPGIHCHFMRG